ncbi:hypothetical protein FB45DRAFT_1061721 [Roridomyces roridus]|uniref:GATA-type domain-containing protein n=1 Tax=Roridomyces roridus TaxID=1738132 RepID=A0AAD7FJ66_9AGAR|nr:hypothetical protein FB45DRAFT_1061721 [Roridomyces roridus]
MTALFSTVFEREDTGSSPRYAYWGHERSYAYTQYRAEPLGPSYPPINPTVDFAGLIPMYDPVSPNSRNGGVELPYTEWRQPHPQSYPTLQDPETDPGPGRSALWQTHPSTPVEQHPSWDSSPPSSSRALVQRFNEYIPYSPPSSAGSSSSPSSSYYVPTPPSTTNSLPRVYVSRRGPGNTHNHTTGEAASKSCSHCHVTSTPLWRRDPSTHLPLCNACGLYLQQRHKLRPQELIDADNDDPEEEGPQISDKDYQGPKCSHCLTRHTSVWRRSKTGAQVCNACGVYMRLRGKERPLSLRRNKIKPRTKHSK